MNWSRIRKYILKRRLHPIHVYVVHNVTPSYSTIVGERADWMSVADFRESLLELKAHKTFITIEEALQHIANDKIRLKDYAVLTADDGYRSVYEQLPWLTENEIPITLFINPAYLDGHSCSDHVWNYAKLHNPKLSKEMFIKERYMTASDIQSITSDQVTIASHGYEHTDNAQMSESEFSRYVEQTIAEIEKYHPAIPFHAYPWGSFSNRTDRVLTEKKICPVRADGWYNINDATQIHREYLPSTKGNSNNV